MYTTPILGTPNFFKDFIMECIASSNDIGEIIMHEGYPISFESHQLKGKNQTKPIYEKEMSSLFMR